MSFFEGLIAPDPLDEPQPETWHRLDAYLPAEVVRIWPEAEPPPPTDAERESERDGNRRAS
jgi:hypothetical protein